MQLHSVYFGTGKWERLARVLDYTARKHCPRWEIDVRPVSVKRFSRSPYARPSHLTNTQKMYEWNRVVQESKNGDELLIMDSDAFIVNPMDDVWEGDFDLAYTIRDRNRSRHPLNSGVVLVRSSAAARRFFGVWWQTNLTMLGTPRLHAQWRKTYGGINQASFGCVLSNGSTRGLKVLRLPCEDWNCEDSSWSVFEPERTRIVHVKSGLRRAIFDGRRPKTEAVEQLRELWLSIEAEVPDATGSLSTFVVEPIKRLLASTPPHREAVADEGEPFVPEHRASVAVAPALRHRPTGRLDGGRRRRMRIGW